MSDPLFEGDDDGNTPLEAEEREQLIPSYITTRDELNEAELANIADALRWVGRRKRKVLDQGFLNELQERSAEKGGPLTVLLPRAPGAREPRWAQLLCGPVDLSALAAGAGGAGVGAGAAAAGGLQARVDALESQVAQLRATVQRLCSELGLEPAPLSPPGQD